MSNSVEKKIREIQIMASEQKLDSKKMIGRARPDFPNSLADHIKTEEQARIFMLLLRSLQQS